jgi:hypothetical protein
VPAARLELARLAAADFESATSTDFVTRAGRDRWADAVGDYVTRVQRALASADTIHAGGDL